MQRYIGQTKGLLYIFFIQHISSRSSDFSSVTALQFSSFKPCKYSIRESESSGVCHKLLEHEMVMKSDNEQSYSRDVPSSLLCVICTKIIATFCWICIP